MSLNELKLTGMSTGNVSVYASEKKRKQDKGTIPKFKAKIRKVESKDGRRWRFRVPEQAGGKPVHSDKDRKSTGTRGKDPPLASVPNR